MSGDRNESANGPSKVAQSLHELQKQLGCLLGTKEVDLDLSRRFVDLIAESERRRVWQLLREAGLDLPDLRLPRRVLLAAALLVTLPVVLLSFIVHWSAACVLFELHALAHKISRPWATSPVCGCETLHEAALCLTPFALADYRAGLWSNEDIEAKVRLIICRSLDIPFASINKATRFFDICEC
jgi:hypothetical protein